MFSKPSWASDGCETHSLCARRAPAGISRGCDIPKTNLLASAHGTASCSLAPGLHSAAQARAERGLPVHANRAIERRRGEPRARARADLFRIDERLSLHRRPLDDRALQARSRL